MSEKATTELVVRTVETPTGFEGQPLAMIPPSEVGALSAVMREESEIKAAIVLAKKFPRNENACYTKLLKSCERPSFAESAFYRFPRGGQAIEGPSVDLAREAARCWGNVRYGLRIVAQDDEWVHIMGWAFDLESNNFVSAEDKFKKLVQRKGGWVRPDERDLRELVNRRGAICVRNSLLQILPSDVIDDALRAAKETMRKATAGDLKQNREDALRRMALAFQGLAVTVEMIESYLGHPMNVATEEEMVNLRQIYKAMVDGVAKRDEFFAAPAPQSQQTQVGSIDMSQAVAGTPPPPKQDPTPPKKEEESKGKKGQRALIESEAEGDDG